MNTYRIEIKTPNGWTKYGNTPISAQACAVKYQLEQKGFVVRLVKDGIVH